MSIKLNGFKLFADGQEIGTATSIVFPKIDPEPLHCAVKQFSDAIHSLSIKLENSKTKYWIGFDGCAQYYKELEQLKNRRLLPGTCIGEIK